MMLSSTLKSRHNLLILCCNIYIFLFTCYLDYLPKSIKDHSRPAVKRCGSGE